MVQLERGRFWERVRERAANALRQGALRLLATECELVRQDRVEFVVRLLADVDRKAEAGAAQRRSGANPFLPYDEDLFVADLSHTHLCLLNKFSVIEHHILVVTRVFEEQESLITLADFQAMGLCMAEFEALAFYNAGAVAGASQRHRHLQLVPVPLGRGPEEIPIDPILASADFEEPVGRARGLPFLHAMARAEAFVRNDPAETAEATLATYRELLRAVGDERGERPYNLLTTRRWMLLVPRSREAYQSIAVNALGFACSLLVRSRDQLALIQQRGPLQMLRKVAVPRP
jgi:ATP adenylyltransferase